MDVSLADIIRDGMARIASRSDTIEMFQGFEGDAVTLNFAGDRTITITVKGGKPAVIDGPVENAKGVADVEPVKFAEFLDGRQFFGGMFVHDYLNYFVARKGEFYDFGGDFMMLAAVSDKLTKLYREDVEFHRRIDDWVMTTSPHGC